MSNLHDIIIVGALSSLAFLWAIAALGALASVNDTFGEYMGQLLERIKR